MLNKILENFVKIKDELDRVNQKVSHLRRELDYNTAELIEFLKQKNMIQIKDIDNK